MVEQRVVPRQGPVYEGNTYWVITSRWRGLRDVMLLEESGGEQTLPVFGSEEEARSYLGPHNGDWRVRKVHNTELISLLLRRRGEVRRVALDPIPGEDPALVSAGWGIFLDSLLGRGRHWFENGGEQERGYW